MDRKYLGWVVFFISANWVVKAMMKSKESSEIPICCYLFSLFGRSHPLHFTFSSLSAATGATGYLPTSERRGDANKKVRVLFCKSEGEGAQRRKHQPDRFPWLIFPREIPRWLLKNLLGRYSVLMQSVSSHLRLPKRRLKRINLHMPVYKC